ncbi:MAG: hypothetical protein Q4D94_10305 [Bacillota bacterium]|nr:hypothetical protein [Bacillota bacterium]
MTCYELTFWLEDEQQKRLSNLAEKYKSYNNWNEKDLLQFALTVLANNSNTVEMMLEFLELKLEQINETKNAEKEDF